MLQVYIAQHPTDAHYVKGLLETLHIECFVKGETLFSVRGEVPIIDETAPSVWIFDETRLTEAKAVVDEYEDSLAKEETDLNNWVCDGCGEELEQQFTSCWNCGTTR